MQYINRSIGAAARCGKGLRLTQEESYLLSCQRYIELNPVRAGMVDHPAGIPLVELSGECAGELDSVIEPHPLYLVLTLFCDIRQAAYQELFRHELDLGRWMSIRQATNRELCAGG